MKASGRCVLIALACLLANAGVGLPQAIKVLPDKDRILDGQPEGLFSIGAADGESWEILAGVKGVAFDPEGTLYVLDGGGFRVLVFGPGGEFIRSFGREGDGPGEFRDPASLAILRNGRIAVADYGKQVIHVYEASGSHVDSHRFTGRPERGTNRLVPHPLGGVTYHASVSDTMSRQGILVHVPSNTLQLFRHPLDPGSQEEALFQTSVGSTEGDPDSAADGKRVLTSRSPAFAPILRWAMFRDGSYGLVTGTRYEVRVANPDGRTQNLLSRAISPRLTTENDRTKRLDALREDLKGTTGITASGGASGTLPPEIIARIVATTLFADTIPVIRDIDIDLAGNVWIMRETDPAGGVSGLIDIVDSDGTYLGSIRDQSIPAAFGPLGLAAYVQIDADWGIERVVVRRIPVSWR